MTGRTEHARALVRPAGPGGRGAPVRRGRVWVHGAQSYRPFGTAAQYTVVPTDLAVPPVTVTGVTGKHPFTPPSTPPAAPPESASAGTPGTASAASTRSSA
ncbi:hypothetical protein F3K43_01410 [Streptomyces sp. LBUM 1476]|nr:hypothetical protein [Streptomyces sp. LBUM 1476]